jgi:exodeoxyribonuclease V gamma subunit
MLTIHRAERADGLVAALGGLLETPLDDPMAAEVVSVPTRGIERWLIQQLSQHLGTTPGRADGVCANVEFPFPGALLTRVVAAVEGFDAEADPWAPERCVWPLLEVVQESLGEPWLATVAAHLGAGGPEPDPARRARRFALARHVADLFDRYGVHRPAMVRAWYAGGDVDASGRPLPPGAAWQAELWRRLRHRLGTGSPAERLEGVCAALAAGRSEVDLPARFSLFGLTRLPPSQVELLKALATHRDVHLFLLHPSPALWDAVAGTGAALSPPGRRAEDLTGELAANTLLASWGRDAREMQLVVLAAGAAGEQHTGVAQAPGNLLRRIQADVHANRPPPGLPLPGGVDDRLALADDDCSVQVHACHGRARQVEVLRDAILHLLADDQTLQPRDVIVMCPDIEEFAPLIQATFGAGEAEAGAEAGTGDGAGDRAEAGAPAGRPPRLHVRLADRSIRQTNPVLGVVAELLELAGGRATVSQVLDLAGRDPVRRRFRFDDDELARVKDWVVAAGVRWGLDAAGRIPFGLGGVDANTWRVGLDRVLLGVTMADEDQRLVAGVVPFDDIGSSAIDLAGRFAEFVDRLGCTLEALRAPAPIAHWAAALGAAADGLTDCGRGSDWQRVQLGQVLDDVVGEATGADGMCEVALSLTELRGLLADRLRGRPTRANFRTGHLTVCTLVPMRSVPHRVVCLLGLDDGVFPRRTTGDGDDLTAADPHVGDRDPRSEDRQLLLDALLAATDCLVITYTGHDERTNAPRPPAVPIGELLDVVDRTARREGSQEPARSRVVVHHPLQPFDSRSFTPGAILRDRPWSFDPVALGGARALTLPRVPAPAFLSGPLPARRADPLELEDLVRFVQNPVQSFLRARLGVRLPDPGEEPDESMPVELDGLRTWAVGHRLLEARLAGADPERCARAESARGQLPPGRLGSDLLERVSGIVEAIVAAAAPFTGAGAPRSTLEVDVQVPGGPRLVGSVGEVIGDVLVAADYSRVAPKHRLAAWVRYLALVATHPHRGFRTATIGRARAGARRMCVTTAGVGPFPGDAERRRGAALAQLSLLVDLYRRGMQEPLPIYCDTSAAFAAAVADGRDGEGAAQKAWESTYGYDREDKKPEHVLVLGGVRPLREVLEAVPRDDEGPGWDAGEPTRFGRYARRLWDGLLSGERMEDR